MIVQSICSGAGVRLFASRAGAILPLLLVCALAADRVMPARAAAHIGLPPLMLWAWDRDDDLRFLDPRDTGVAFLAATLTLRGDGVELNPRHNRLNLPDGLKRVAVVHVESDRAAPPSLSGEQLRRFVEAIAEVSDEVPHDVLQVDYEAVASQRAFFIAALDGLRLRLPGAPLSVTALASWCLNERWTVQLAADEVVPMLFRMGYEGRRVRALFENHGDFREPGCRLSLGVATNELPAVLPAGRRVYVFNPRRWSAQSYAAVRTRVRQWSRLFD